MAPRNRKDESDIKIHQDAYDSSSDLYKKVVKDSGFFRGIGNVLTKKDANAIKKDPKLVDQLAKTRAKPKESLSEELLQNFLRPQKEKLGGGWMLGPPEIRILLDLADEEHEAALKRQPTSVTAKEPADEPKDDKGQSITSTSLPAMATISKKRPAAAVEDDSDEQEAMDDLSDNDDPRIFAFNWTPPQLRQRITRLIKSKEMTIKDFCERIGNSQTSYRNFMNERGMKGQWSDTFENATRFFNKRDILGIRTGPHRAKKARVSSKTKKAAPATTNTTKTASSGSRGATTSDSRQAEMTSPGKKRRKLSTCPASN